MGTMSEQMILIHSPNYQTRHKPQSQDCNKLTVQNSMQRLLAIVSCYGMSNSLNKCMKTDYVPNETEMLMVRYRTTGVLDQKFTLEKNEFHVFDVGGQKSERKKWIHCFDNVTAVIFVAALSCFDQLMFEDEGNQMVDSLQTFDNIANNEYFVDTSIILFLNKKDLFIEKIKTKSIKICEELSGFDGDERSYEETTEFIKDVFVSRNKIGTKSIFTHLTCATDANNVRKVFNDVQHIVIQKSLVNAGVMGGDYEDDL